MGDYCTMYIEKETKKNKNKNKKTEIVKKDQINKANKQQQLLYTKMKYHIFVDEFCIDRPKMAFNDHAIKYSVSENT